LSAFRFHCKEVFTEAMAQSICLGVAGASFWRKDFIKTDLLPVVVCVMGARVKSTWPSTCTLAVGFWWNPKRVVAGVRKNGLMFTFLALIHCARQKQGCQIGFNTWACLATVAATFQLTRQPIWLKDWLRPLRVATGPVYWLCSIAAFVQTMWDGCFCDAVISAMGISLVSTASVILRPDNVEFEAAIASLMRCEVCTRDQRKRALVHGMLMICSMVLLAGSTLRRGRLFTASALLILLLVDIFRRLQR